jgi:hypothetical protein
LAPMCPHCGREAPIVYRGPLAYCTACSRARPPLSAAGVNVTGTPAKVGGVLASVVGWVVLAIMLAVALIFGAILQAIVGPGAILGWVVGGVIAALGIAASLALLAGGRFLRKTGQRAALSARRDALFALAQHHKGIVRANLVSRSLGMSSVEAEAVLTELSRNPESGITLEVDVDGQLYYRFVEIAPEAPWPPPDRASSDQAVSHAPTERMRVAPKPSTSPMADDEPVESVDDEKATKRVRTVI